MTKKKASTTDESALLGAICAVPEDDTPRLVYADWLQENDQPERAEFIRVQCQLARLDESDPEWPQLQWREGQLLTNVRKKAWAELPVKPVKEKLFNRGFIDDVTLDTALFLQGADKLFSQIPLRALRPLAIGPVCDELLASPHLLRLRGLDLHISDLNQTHCEALAASEQLANLHELNLGANKQMGTPGFNAILGSRHLSRLRRLTLNSNGIGNDALARFVGNTNFPHLRELDLSNNKIGPEGVSRLARATWLSQLECLDLSHNPLGDDGVRRLAESGILAGHKSLRLREVDLGCEGLRSLVNCPHLSELTELIINKEYGIKEYGDERDDFLKGIAQSTTLTKLTKLRLSGRGLCMKVGVEALVRSPLAARLRALELDYLPDDAFEALLTAPSLSGLTWLCVRGIAAEIDLVGLLHSATHLKNLHFLKAGANYLRDKDMAVLADCAHLGGLAVLSLDYGDVSEGGVQALIASPHFNRLHRLELPCFLKHPTIRPHLIARFGEIVLSHS